MTRGSMAAAVLGAMLASSGFAAAATVERDGGVRVITRADRQPDARALDDLLERSGLRVQLESLTAGIRAQFLRAHRRQSSQDRITIDRIVTERFAADTLYARIKAEFQRNLDSDPLEKALAWYDSPLGQRITGQELAALVATGGAEAVADLERNRPSSRRIDLLGRLDAGGGASETTVDITVAIVRSLTRAFQPGLPAVADLTPGQLDQQIAQARNRTLADMRRACLVSMLLAYRGLSDDELDQYVRFVESESGNWYMGVMNSALLVAINAAAESTAAELKTAVPQLVGDLR
ncbi:MAG: hypothetical protein DME00_20830 [Candidatus Rokuibacteriota bacterium]|nr:MAG: hypothetical protein DME00_20830 [Candidatus Rokubacteria bacterium]PYO05017.1 MAG: hypothetical protein DMD75_29560 [Candidatus Rokubacteria bacterium]